MSRKQQLLKRHRRNKRLALLVALAALIALGLVTWWLPLLLLPLLWVAHEAWLADHLFYTPADDYTYAFDGHAGVKKPAQQGATQLNLQHPRGAFCDGQCR